LAGGVEHLEDALVRHQVQHGGEVEARRQRIHRDRLFGPRELDEAELRPVGAVAHEFGVDGDVGRSALTGAEGFERLGIGNEHRAFSYNGAERLVAACESGAACAMSRVLLFVLLPVLAACAPPALTIATSAAAGASYAATGKTMTDHGISVATARDCEIIARLLDGRPICIDRVPDPAIPVEDPRRSRLFLVVGSFSDPGNAEREARRHASLGARVI